MALISQKGGGASAPSSNKETEMSKKTVAICGYRAIGEKAVAGAFPMDDKVEAKVFECEEGKGLPAGWVDSPAKVSKPKKRKA